MNRTTGWDRCKPVAADTPRGPANDLSTNITAFCTLLRTEHRFPIGQPETRDALRALETIGIADRSRARCALRLVCCATHDEMHRFDRAFDAFFGRETGGAAQPAHAGRHTRPEREQPAARGPDRPAERTSTTDHAPGPGRRAAERQPDDDGPNDATAWQALRARYSPSAATAPPPQLSACDFDGMLAAAGRLIAAVRLGRSRRPKSMPRGGRFDLRRTIRASLQTGGEPVDLRFLGHPLRNPRFVVLIDGSRSMAEQTGSIVAFARALCERSTRTSVFSFSTELRDITRALRAATLGGRLEELGHAWGGGTKIGANLDVFVAEYGLRLLTPDTLVLIYSDGLDAGDVPRLERAMRNIDRRSAGVVWLNPHADTAGYRPIAGGMRAALPFITLLTAARDARGFAALASRLATHPRIASHRR